jgi:hypothetical protein
MFELKTRTKLLLCIVVAVILVFGVFITGYRKFSEPEHIPTREEFIPDGAVISNARDRCVSSCASL